MFHRRLVQLSDHFRLQAVWDSMQAQIRPLARRALDHESADIVEIARHHSRVLDAIRGRDPDRARELVERHIVQASERALAVLLRDQDTAEQQATEGQKEPQPRRSSASAFGAARSESG
jgi:DNA-binding GntR family transcriptional regulator